MALPTWFWTGGRGCLEGSYYQFWDPSFGVHPLVFAPTLKAIPGELQVIVLFTGGNATFTIKVTPDREWGCNARINPPDEQVTFTPGVTQREVQWFLCEAGGIPAGKPECGAGSYRVEIVGRGLWVTVVVAPPPPWPGTVASEPSIVFDLRTEPGTVSVTGSADPSIVPTCSNSQTYYSVIQTWWEGPTCVKAQRSFFSGWTGNSFCQDQQIGSPPCCANASFVGFEWQASPPGQNQWGTIGFGQNITHIVSNDMDVRAIWKDNRGSPGARGVSPTMFVPFCGPPP